MTRLPPADGTRPWGQNSYSLGFLTWAGATSGRDEQVLLCDPLTGLVAYPSFQEHLTGQLPDLVSVGLHLAIGDVDDLKRYVTTRRATDPTMFGHLAGNECMRRVGAITLEWANRTLSRWPFAICGTFGGDEVIVAAAGRPYPSFVRDIEHLARRLRRSAPRSCSFAVASVRAAGPITDAAAVYRQVVARTDAALFDHKEMRRSRGLDPRGEVIDVGAVRLG